MRIFLFLAAGSLCIFSTRTFLIIPAHLVSLFQMTNVTPTVQFPI